MIWESYYWKRDLLNTVFWLKRTKEKFTTIEGEIDEKLSVKLEQKIFIGFYSIRKLLETKKFSKQIHSCKIPIQYFSNVKNVNHLNWHKIEELFDLDSLHNEKIKLVVLANYFIHSYIFLPSFENDQLSGIFISSDKIRNKKVYFLNLEQLYFVFNMVGNDNPTKIEVWRDSDNDFDIKLE
ncbi:hypothetical protein [Desulfovibrio sp. QI0434]